MHTAGKDSESTPNRFLVILPRQLGDVILGLPIIHELRKHFPQAKIAWLAHPLAREALDGHPELNEVFYLPQGRLRYINKQRGIVGQLEKAVGQFFLDVKFILKIRAYKADVVIDAMNNPRTALLSFLSGAAKRISFRTRFQRNIMFTHLIDRMEVSLGYLGNSRLKLLGPLEINNTPEYSTPLFPEVDALRIYRSSQQAEKITHLLGSYPIDLNARPFIVLCPPHRRDVRRWPKESFLELARQIVFKHNIPVVWLWGPGEDVLVEPLHLALEQEIKNRHKAIDVSLGMSCLLPLLSIKETAELCSRALCWVGNSSGLSHVAVAAGCRTIEIHGPTNPIPWTHPDMEQHRSVTRMTGCLGCEGAICKLQRRECLDDLGPETVLRQLEDLLKL
jgi:ADP-heptose:LPS heptosyltransferase